MKRLLAVVFPLTVLCQLTFIQLIHSQGDDHLNQLKYHVKNLGQYFDNSMDKLSETHKANVAEFTKPIHENSDQDSSGSPSSSSSSSSLSSPATSDQTTDENYNKQALPQAVMAFVAHKPDRLQQEISLAESCKAVLKTLRQVSDTFAAGSRYNLLDSQDSNNNIEIARWVKNYNLCESYVQSFRLSLASSLYDSSNSAADEGSAKTTSELDDYDKELLGEEEEGGVDDEDDDDEQEEDDDYGFENYEDSHEELRKPEEEEDDEEEIYEDALENLHFFAPSNEQPDDDDDHDEQFYDARQHFEYDVD